MDSNSPTKSTKQKVINNLLQGYELATQLQLLLTTSGDSTTAVDDLLSKILGSFNKTLLVLDSFDLETSRNASCGDDDSAAPVTCNGEDSGESKKRSLGSGKGKRGCYARKKRSQTWTLESRKIEDKHCWRKYGQKEILNATFPRSYFRCTYKPTQGCKAMKQVQKLEHDPEMFQITYIGYHTCNTKTKTHDNDHEIIMDSDTTWPTHDQVKVKSQEHENNSSSITVVGPVGQVGPVGPGTVKEEENNNDFSSGELSLVWRDILMFDETTSIDSYQQVVDSMMFSSNNYTFNNDNNNNNNNNDHFSSFFDHYCV